MTSLGEELDDSTGNKAFYGSVRRDGIEYKIGDSCYIEPSGFSFNIKPVPIKKSKSSKNQVYCKIIPTIHIFIVLVCSNLRII